MTAPVTSQDAPRKRPVARLWVVALALAFGTFFLWIEWPTGSDIDPISLSNEDGKSRFWVTTHSKMELSPNIPWRTRLMWKWIDFQKRHRKPNPAAYTFPASAGVMPCSIEGLLNQCMEVSGTHYLIAVECCAGTVYFGHTNAIGGAQFVADFEHTIETNGPQMCYDFAKKRHFQDTLVLIREKPGVVKIVPRTKLADYQKEGLVKSLSP